MITPIGCTVCSITVSSPRRRKPLSSAPFVFTSELTSPTDSAMCVSLMSAPFVFTTELTLSTSTDPTICVSAKQNKVHWRDRSRREIMGTGFSDFYLASPNTT